MTYVEHLARVELNCVNACDPEREKTLDVHAEGTAVDGKWGAVLQFPVIPVATALLPSGKVRPRPFSMPLTRMCIPLCPGYAVDT